MTGRGQFQRTVPVDLCVGLCRPILYHSSKAVGPVCTPSCVFQGWGMSLPFKGWNCLFTLAYVMSRFKLVFAGQTTVLCNLSLFSSAFITLYPSTTLSLFLSASIMSAVFVYVRLRCAFACSPRSICLPGSRWCPCCYKQEQLPYATQQHQNDQRNRPHTLLCQLPYHLDLGESDAVFS